MLVETGYYAKYNTMMDGRELNSTHNEDDGLFNELYGYEGQTGGTYGQQQFQHQNQQQYIDQHQGELDSLMFNIPDVSSVKVGFPNYEYDQQIQQQQRQPPVDAFNFGLVAERDHMQQQQQQLQQQQQVPPPVAPSPTSKSPRGDTTKKTSLEVFLKFVVVRVDPKDPEKNVIDASGVLSVECYNHWLETRRGILKYPEESFRRSLTAHVSGLDGRKAFPVEIEKALLLELRKQRVWRCFEGKTIKGKPIKIGLQGFRTKGFHESKHKGATSTAERKKKKSKRPAPTVEALEELPSSPEPSVVVYSQQETMGKWKDNMVLLEILVSTFKLGRLEMIDATIGDDETIDKNLLLVSPLAKPSTVRAKIAYNIVRCIPPHIFSAYFGVIQHLAADSLLNDETLDLLRIPVDFPDPRLQAEFIRPTKEEQVFRDDRPIGHNTFCPQTAVFTASDESSREILCGDVTGTHMSVNTGGLHWWLALCRLTEVLKRDTIEMDMQSWRAFKGVPQWYRAFHKSKDGAKSMVTLSKYTWEGDKIYTTFQDVSDQFPELFEMDTVEERVKQHLAGIPM